VQAEIGNPGIAVDYFNKAIRKNKRYIPAYSYLADLLIELKQYSDAEKILKIGLKYKDSKALKRRLVKVEKLKNSSKN